MKYSEHGNSIVHSAGQSLKERCKTEIHHTYVDHLQGIQFQLKNLKSGRPLPRLIGRDVYGIDFDSEELKGKAVLIFFTSSLYTDRKNFDNLRSLKKRFAGRPFEIVSVMVDQKIEEAKEAVDSGKITWLTLYDEEQELKRKWQFHPCSDRLLIDHEGIIQRRSTYGTDLNSTIQFLVEEAERTPR